MPRYAIAASPTGLPKPKSYFFLSMRIAGPVPPSSESRQPIATSSCDWRGSSTLLKKVKATTLAMSTRLEVAAMESLRGLFMNGFLRTFYLALPVLYFLGLRATRRSPLHLIPSIVNNQPSWLAERVGRLAWGSEVRGNFPRNRTYKWCCHCPVRRCDEIFLIPWPSSTRRRNPPTPYRKPG